MRDRLIEATRKLPSTSYVPEDDDFLWDEVDEDERLTLEEVDERSPTSTRSSTSARPLRQDAFEAFMKIGPCRQKARRRPCTARCA